MNDGIDALRQRATAAGISLRAFPPEPTTCCGRGCAGCVWEGYHAAVAYWYEDAELALASCHNEIDRPRLG